MDLTLVSYMVLIALLGIVTFYDIKSLIIPDRILLVGGFIGLVLLFSPKSPSITSVMMALGVVGGLGWTIAYLTKGGLGLGDVKLLACLGIYTGLWQLVNIVLISSLLSGGVGLVLLVVGRVNKKTVMPFAPFVLLSTVLVLLGGK